MGRNAMPGRNIPEDNGSECGEQSKNNESNNNCEEMLRVGEQWGI